MWLLDRAIGQCQRAAEDLHAPEKTHAGDVDAGSARHHGDEKRVCGILGQDCRRMATADPNLCGRGATASFAPEQDGRQGGIWARHPAGQRFTHTHTGDSPRSPQCGCQRRRPSMAAR
eukprot:7390356-Prymnesium_polylepis.2